MQDKQIIIKRIRDCDNCRFRPETSKVCEIYDNCYLVSEHIANLREQLRNKEQECEELKEILNEGCLHNLTLMTEQRVLLQTLTEIKEIAEINPINTCWTVLELCEKCDENKECDIQCPLFKFKLILQKISECEV